MVRDFHSQQSYFSRSSTPARNDHNTIEPVDIQYFIYTYVMYMYIYLETLKNATFYVDCFLYWVVDVVSFSIFYIVT